jgi:uncharacterized protein YndB with AHSA1/START domain
MKSVIAVEINAPPSKVAELFDNPQGFRHWMDDVARVEPLNGGSRVREGSAFRLVPTKGGRAFVGRIVDSDPPHRSQLTLDASTVSIDITGTFFRMSDNRTQLVSEEQFGFKGPFGHLLGLFGRPAIRRAHRRHMDAFKRFAEAS